MHVSEEADYERTDKPLIRESIPRRETRNTTIRQTLEEEGALTRMEHIDGNEIHPILAGYTIVIRCGESRHYRAYVLVTELHNEKGIINHNNDNENPAPPRVQGAVQYRIFIAEQRNGGAAQIAAAQEALTREVTQALDNADAIVKRNNGSLRATTHGTRKRIETIIKTGATRRAGPGSKGFNKHGIPIL